MKSKKFNDAKLFDLPPEHGGESSRIPVTQQMTLSPKALDMNATRFRNILDHLPDMIGYWDRNLRNQFANRAYLKWLGLSHEVVLGKHIKEVLGKELFLLNLPYIDKVLLGEEQTFERQITNPRDMTQRSSLARYIPDVQDGKVVGFFVSVSDVSQLKQAEGELSRSREILEKSEERFRNVVMDQTELISRLRGDGTYIFANDVFCHFFGKTMEEIQLTNWHPLVYPDDKERVERELSELSMNNSMIMIENRVVSATGEVHWMQFSNRGFFSETGELLQIQSVGRDITQRKKAEFELLELNARLETSQQLLRDLVSKNDVRIERERKHFAQEVHDELGQVLTALLMDLLYLEMRYTALDQDFHAKIREMKNMVDAAIDGVRNVASSLRPVAIDMGLASAIKWLCSEHSRKTNADCQFETSLDTKHFYPEKTLVLFRIVQESLTNIMRHASASFVLVKLYVESTFICLEVIDNGVGFDLHAVDASRSFGMLGMRERAIALDGHFNIESHPGQGTKIQVLVPRPTI